MGIVSGKVVNGRIEIDAFDLPEGTEVEVYIRVGAYHLTPEEEAELEESMAQLDRGEYVDGDEFLQGLRLRRQQS